MSNHNPPENMTPSQPYLLRALNLWIVDNGLTPQILIDSAHPELNIPDAVRAENKVVLNISPSAVRDLEIDNEYISFVARFAGKSHAVLVPVEAVQAVYARENGKGMMFPEEPSSEENRNNADRSAGSTGDKNETGSKESGKGRGRPNLKVIK